MKTAERINMKKAFVAWETAKENYKNETKKFDNGEENETKAQMAYENELNMRINLCNAIREFTDHKISREKVMRMILMYPDSLKVIISA